MKRYVRLLAVIFFQLSAMTLLAQRPKLSVNFDNGSTQKGIQSIQGISGKAVQQQAGINARLTTNFFTKSGIQKAFTLEFWAAGERFYFGTIGTQNVRIELALDELLFFTTVKAGGKEIKDGWKVSLRYAPPFSYASLTDGNWHHFVFQMDVNAGVKRVWIDGKLTSFSERKISKADAIVTGPTDGFGRFGKLDELAMYDYMLSAGDITAHYSKLKKDDPSLDEAEARTAPAAGSQGYFSAGVDPKEFAPGYPNYTVQAIDQLRYFPDPRYKSSRKMPRNFSWMDISYIHRELPGNGGKGFGKTDPDKAVAMINELVNKWNYYLEVPCLRYDSSILAKKYGTPGNIEYAIINYARSHPELPTSSVLMEIQGKPNQAGFDRKTAYATAQDLPAQYYMQDASGKPLVVNRKKWLSPLAPLDIIQKDGLTAAFYLRQVQRYLGRPVNFLNDNGEIFGHIRGEGLLKQDPKVWADYKRSGLTASQYSAVFQARMDETFKATVLNAMNWKNTQFTFYNVSAYNDPYWPDYSRRRKTNTVFGGKFHYSTPSFYPARPDNWRTASGPLNGYGTVANGRRKEIQLGDSLFAPFVSAGWNMEEKNIRPAQWLALLKAMAMLGAEFFHVGYFNVTGKTGWPNGAGPNDPRGYIYQAAMPAYVQALVSNNYNIWRQSVLLNPQASLNPDIYSFRMKASKENHLVMVRKQNKRYLIYGSIQPSSNFKGNAPLEEATTINLEGRSVTFNVRRQGSMYILDLSSSKPVFYQLDKWHQYEHPYYWSKDAAVEAENAVSFGGSPVIETLNNNQYDFRNFTTVVSMTAGQSITLEVPDKNRNDYSCTLTVRNDGGDNATISIGNVQKSIGSNKWTDVSLTKNEVGNLISARGGTVTIKVTKGKVDIDKVVF